MTRALFALLLTLASSASAQSGFAFLRTPISVSETVEPNSAYTGAVGLSLAVSADVARRSPSNGWVSTPYSMSLRFGTGSTILAGVGKTFVTLPGPYSIVGDLQAGVSGGHAAVAAGPGLRLDMGRGYSVTGGVRLSSLGSLAPRLSGYVSLAKAFGR